MPVQGTGYISEISLDGKTTYQPGHVFLSQAINPTQLGVGRLQNQAAMYERFLFTHLAFIWTGRSNPLLSGGLIGYFVNDLADAPSQTEMGAPGVKDAHARAWKLSCRVTDGGIVWMMPPGKMLQEYFCLPDPGDSQRLTTMGYFVLMAETAITSTEATTVGVLSCDYQCRLDYPKAGNNLSSCAKVTGGGTMSQTDLLGTNSSVASWSTLAVTRTGNAIAMPAAAYSITLVVWGTGLSTASWSYSGGSQVTGASAAESTTKQMDWIQCVFAVPGTLTIACNATTVTDSWLIISQLPPSALTVTMDRDWLLRRVMHDAEELESCIKGERRSEKKELVLSAYPAAAASEKVFVSPSPHGFVFAP